MVEGVARALDLRLHPLLLRGHQPPTLHEMERVLKERLPGVEQVQPQGVLAPVRFC